MDYVAPSPVDKFKHNQSWAISVCVLMPTRRFKTVHTLRVGWHLSHDSRCQPRAPQRLMCTSLPLLSLPAFSFVATPSPGRTLPCGAGSTARTMEAQDRLGKPSWPAAHTKRDGARTHNKPRGWFSSRNHLAVRLRGTRVLDHFQSRECIDEPDRLKADSDYA